MKKIGFIDYFLSEWHANNYPIWIDECAKKSSMDVKVEYAFALKDVSPKDGVTTDVWCRKYNIKKCETIEELVDKSDFIVILAPDNPEMHFELSSYALRSGKPVFIDKTFAMNLAEAREMFNIALNSSTPMYSSSALRFSTEIEEYRTTSKKANSALVVGAGNFNVYLIHPVEMLVAVMKTGAKRIMCTLSGGLRSFTIEYDDGRRAELINTDNLIVPYQIYIEEEHNANFVINSDFFRNFTSEMLNFFYTGKQQVDEKQTLEVMSIIDSAKIAIQSPLSWIKID